MDYFFTSASSLAAAAALLAECERESGVKACAALLGETVFLLRPALLRERQRAAPLFIQLDGEGAPRWAEDAAATSASAACGVCTSSHAAPRLRITRTRLHQHASWTRFWRL